jgi:trk system potassium uptake protein TrkH
MSSNKSRTTNSAIKALNLEGMLYALAGVPPLVCAWHLDLNFLFQKPWIITALILSVVCITASSLYCSKKPVFGKFFAFSGFILAMSACLTEIIVSPLTTLATVVLVSFFIYFVNENIPETKNIYRRTEWNIRIFHRVRIAAVTTLPFLLISFTFCENDNILALVFVAVCGFIPGIMGLLWSINNRHTLRAWLNMGCFAVIFLFVIFGFLQNSSWIWFSILWPAGNLVFLSRNLYSKTEDTSWLDPLLNHPARLLVSVFFLLIVIGTILLMQSVASSGKWIAPIDAAFTSVSAVCITGLIVLDTPVDFSVTGQFFILLLIQAGGLGIMTIATIAIHTFRKRFSLKQERILSTVSGDNRSQLYKSLKRVLIFTFLTESAGAVILSILFFINENSLLSAVWRAVFTSVSAFCNAGFALQSNSLVDYQQNPLVLHTVAILIILGGLSPAVCVFIPDFISGKKIPTPTFLVFVTTGILLISGTIVIATVEWDSSLGHLSLLNKIHNAWFQSVTLRTAGFNSIDIASMAAPSYLVMLIFMFIGGSPGGTAGGIKTTTLAVFILCMSSIAKGQDGIIVKNQKIDSETIYKAIAVTGACLLFLFISIMTLELTQFISVKEIIFESFSALGTVGLSIGATSRLNEIGKIIIMIMMFFGRIGPLTMFMILSNPISTDRRCYPSAKIPIT